LSQQNCEGSRSARTAEIRAAQNRKERNRRIALIAGIVVVLGAIVAGGAWYTSGGSAKTSSDTSASVTAGDGSVIVGPSTAPTKVTVYEDFQCPYCRQLEDQTRDFLRENAHAGKVQVEYRPIDLLRSPYGERGMNAFAAVLKHSTAKAALKLHDLLYENQPYESQSGSVTDSDILGFVKQAGGDNSEVEVALKTQDAAFFGAAAALMQQKKINSTPTVYVNGTPVGGDVTAIANAIEQAVSNG
jgi:protein-disulfide isomerase